VPITYGNKKERVTKGEVLPNVIWGKSADHTLIRGKVTIASAAAKTTVVDVGLTLTTAASIVCSLEKCEAAVKGAVAIGKIATSAGTSKVNFIVYDLAGAQATTKCSAVVNYCIVT